MAKVDISFGEFRLKLNKKAGAVVGDKCPVQFFYSWCVVCTQLYCVIFSKLAENITKSCFPSYFYIIFFIGNNGVKIIQGTVIKRSAPNQLAVKWSHQVQIYSLFPTGPEIHALLYFSFSHKHNGLQSIIGIANLLTACFIFYQTYARNVGQRNSGRGPYFFKKAKLESAH